MYGTLASLRHSMPEDQTGRVLVDILDRLVQLRQGAAAVGGESLEFLQPRIGKLRQPD